MDFVLEQAQHYVAMALAYLERRMQRKPAPYPDPNTPIAKWQLAHQHLLAARELLKEEA